jgi:hypothetical protein
VRSQAGAPRDHDAETFIADAVRSQTYAPYLLAQAVLVQEQALKGADQKIRELEARIAQPQPAAPQSGGFLSGLFGGGAAARQAPPPPQQNSPWGQPAPQPSPYGQQAAPAPSPWGAPQAAQGGGFLKGALGAAAGVAGGMLLADSLKGMFGGGHGGGGLLGGSGGGETIVNNYYEEPRGGNDQNYQNADYQDDSDSGGDFGGDDI